ncbi:adenine phosphoribosyltransferase, partial [Listeria monocytogenes]|nr:adenine phosphoribosyltransferase [Listeria monocytogenes]
LIELKELEGHKKLNGYDRLILMKL